MRYNIYPSLLDAYQGYVDSDKIWERYWGFSENPPHTPEEFRQKQFSDLIDRINRVPYDNEAVAKGTAFNEVIDCIIEHRTSDKINIVKVFDVKETDKCTGVNATIGERTFFFPLDFIKKFSAQYEGAVTQMYVEGVIDTIFGEVYLYGFADEVMPFCVHDIKTASSYSVGKYKNNSQHLVYPYCLRQMGNDVSLFEYNVAVLGKTPEMFTETYAFNETRDTPILRQKCEDFIRFIEENRELITDKKIFNGK